MYRLEALGAAIRDERVRQCISQEKLAEKAKLHRNAIGRIERSEAALTVSSLFSIADALGIKASLLVQRAEHIPPDHALINQSRQPDQPK